MARKVQWCLVRILDLIKVAVKIAGSIIMTLFSQLGPIMKIL